MNLGHFYNPTLQIDKKSSTHVHKSGKMLKISFSRYMRFHRIMCNMSVPSLLPFSLLVLGKDECQDCEANEDG